MKKTSIFLLFLCCAALARAEVKLPALFSDHMVMQADTPVPVWGWAKAGEEVTVAVGAESKVTTADADGKWKVMLEPLKGTDQPQMLTVKGTNTLTVKDVLIGEVWLGGGQSNMAFQVAAPNVALETLAEAKAETLTVRPMIRFFMVTSRGADEPQEDVMGSWAIASPETIGKCSAVAWYFGLALQQKLHTPVGLIVSSVGGTGAEMWIPKKELDATSVGAAIWKRHEEALAGYSKEAEEKYKQEEAAWRKAYPTQELMVKNAKLRPRPFYAPDGSKVPTRLYNGKIAGLEPYAVKGVIWFQADGNGRHHVEYAELIQTLIRTWRAHWHAELPFYYVEMNNMHPLQTKPDEDKPLQWIREAQNAALKLPRTGVVTAIDLGIAENAHFPVKKPVGDRLANLALSEVYHLELGEVHSPEFVSHKVEGDKIRVKLKYADGLRSRSPEVRGFTMKNTEGKWVWAEGKIDGKDLLVWSKDAPSPQEIRYAWAENPILSIENGAGLPLRPFRIVLKKD
jgi:sialate O-acetylesterase